MRTLCKNIFLLVFILIAVVLSSCREEIVSPGNPAGNINEPVLESYTDYYTFKINASKLTLSMTDFAYFNANINYLSFTLLDHKSGSVDVLIWNRNNQTLYNTRFSRDFEKTTIVLDGNVPQFIQIKLNDFTGKISIQLSRY